MFEFTFTSAEYVQIVNALLNRIDFLKSLVSSLSSDEDKDLFDLYSKDLNNCLALYDKMRCS